MVFESFPAGTPDREAITAAENMIGLPPVATPEQLAASEAQTANMFEAAPQKPAEPVQDPNLNEETYYNGIQVVQGVQKPLK